MTNTDRLWLELATIRELAAELAPTATAATLAILYRRVSAAWRAFLASVPGTDDQTLAALAAAGADVAAHERAIASGSPQ